jgi:cyclopropane fatty-acyl-phospholipid synthase-like methyltransferase
MLPSAHSTDNPQSASMSLDQKRQMDMRFLVHLAGTGATEIHPLGPAATTALIEQLKLRPGLRVLDVGCGTGGTMVRFAKYKPARIDGVDVTPAMLRVASQRIRLARLSDRSALQLIEPGGQLPFADASYDRVYTESVLGFQDAEGVQALLREIFRVLKSGGRYVANEAIWRSEVAAETIATTNAACLADFGLRMASDSPWALDEWLAVMREAGFQVTGAALLSEQTRGKSAIADVFELRALLSTALTRIYKLRTYITPARRRERSRFQSLNAQHHDDGLLIEPRLFVLDKPSLSGVSSAYTAI